MRFLWLKTGVLFAIAYFLQLIDIIPLAYRPDWVALALLFVSIRVPSNYHLYLAVLVGLLMDILSGQLLGTYVLSYTALVYITLMLNHRLKMYGTLQQMWLVFVLVGINEILVNWAMTFGGHMATGIEYLWPAFSSALVWPFWLLFGLRLFGRGEFIRRV